MPSIPAIFVLSSGAAIIAIVGFVIVHKFTKPIDLDEHQRFLDAMLNIVGTLVSILLGLLVAAALDHYRSIEQSVDMEAASLASMFRLTAGLPEETGKKIRDQCLKYSDQVINLEWPQMANGRSAPEVLTTYADMVITVVQFRPQNDGEANLHNALISHMEAVGDCRRQRLLTLHDVWTKHLMPILLMCSAIVLIFAYLYVKRGAILHGFLIAMVAVALGGNLGLVFLLSNPFAYDWKIQPRGFRLNAHVLKQIDQNPALHPLMLKYELEDEH